MLNHSLTTLKSGLTVIRIPMDSVQSVTVLALSNTGSRYEKDDKQGIAHFFEHIVFKGTKKFPSTMELAEVVDGVGANFNAFTSKEYTGYYVKAASRHVGLAIDVLSDMLMAPLLRQEDIDKEKGVIIEELNMYMDMPQHHIGNLFEQMVYTGGLSHDIIGTKKTVNSVTTQDFQEFLGTWYGLDNLVVIVAGDERKVGDDSILGEIEDKFLSKKKKTKRITDHDLRDQFISSERISDKKLHVEYKKTEQAHFVLSWPGLERDHEDRFTLNVLNTVLGSSFSSRLFSEVREKRGLCYYVNSDIDMYHGVGLFGASAGVDPSRVEEAVKVTIEQFTSIADGSNKVTGKELARAKEYIAGKMVLGLEDSQSVAQYFGMKQLLSGRIETPTEVLEKIKAVSLDEVNKLATRLIVPGEMRFAVIGPYGEASKFEEFI